MSRWLWLWCGRLHFKEQPAQRRPVLATALGWSVSNLIEILIDYSFIVIVTEHAIIECNCYLLSDEMICNLVVKIRLVAVVVVELC